MLKALFLDMDDTLCDTRRANAEATRLLGEAACRRYGPALNGDDFARDYVRGIYREWRPGECERYMPIIEQQGEGAFRVQLIRDLLAARGIAAVDEADARQLQDTFDRDRLAALAFYPGIADVLTDARQYFTLVVITNGPEFSQRPKVDAVNLAAYVDHILIGGQEPEQKPARSIFEKALRLANCQAHEAIHVGDSLAADIAGAHNSHITSVWIQHQQPLDAELGIHPHHTVLHPSEIPALIRRLQPRPDGAGRQV
jgi:HAD superfamily hydrolase (TIGR01509 family)